MLFQASCIYPIWNQCFIYVPLENTKSNTTWNLVSFLCRMFLIFQRKIHVLNRLKFRNWKCQFQVMMKSDLKIFSWALPLGLVGGGVSMPSDFQLAYNCEQCMSRHKATVVVTEGGTLFLWLHIYYICLVSVRFEHSELWSPYIL